MNPAEKQLLLEIANWVRDERQMEIDKLKDDIYQYPKLEKQLKDMLTHRESLLICFDALIERAKKQGDCSGED